MAKTFNKSASGFLVFFVAFLLVLEVQKIEGEDECLKEYGGDVGFAYCVRRIYPSYCYIRCRVDKGALSGKCGWDAEGGVKCLCDYCSYVPGGTAIQMRTNVV